jgi:hypothetical protein
MDGPPRQRRVIRSRALGLWRLRRNSPVKRHDFEKQGANMKRILQVFLSIVAILSAVILYNLLRDAQWAHSWLKSMLVMLPELGTVIAIFELHHSEKANELRRERNELAKTNNDLAEKNNQLQAQLQTERNEHLAEIAKRMQRPQTVGERNATKLRERIGSQIVAINSDNSRWGGGPLIAEVSDDNIVALFTPAGPGSQAFVVYAECKDVEVIEIPFGACPIQVKVNKRYGDFVQLGEIRKWEDRRAPAANPEFEKGPMAYNAQYGKQGTSETRTLFIYSHRNRTNSFQLVASTGEQFIGNNKDVSIRFLSQQVAYMSEGFHRTTAGTGESPYPLYISN